MAASSGAHALRYWGNINHAQSFALQLANGSSDLRGWAGSWTSEVKRLENSTTERPDSFVLKWTGAKSLEAELFLVELTRYEEASKITRRWRYPIYRRVSGESGFVDFRGLIPSPVWAIRTHPPTSIYFHIRESSVELPKQVTLSSPLELLDNYARNDVAFIFPSSNKVLWACSQDLIKQSDYFAVLFSSSGFAETDKRLAAPELEQKLLEAVSAPRSSSGPGRDDAAVVKAGGKTEAKARSAPEPETAAYEDSDEEEKSSTASPASPRPIYRIVVRDASYRTYRAALFWLATGQISFAHLSSLYPPSSSSSSPSLPPNQTDGALAPASPKSLYRLADYISLAPLKALAFTNLESQLCANNCLAELLSDLAADYPDVREACVAAVLRNWPVLVENGEIDELGRRVVEGELEPRKARVAWDVMSRLKPA
ncbi:hypothetical protein JCM10207_003104 [Rhodosporidiobolus poonsookiae]